MSQSTPYFSLERLAQAHAGDDIEELLIKNIQHQFEELWPSTLRPPDALGDLFVAIATLIDWDGRSPRGRAIMRRRLLRLIAALDHEGQWGPNDLAKNEHAQKVVPGLVQMLQRDDDAQLARVIEPAEAGQLADDVAAWLAGDD